MANKELRDLVVRQKIITRIHVVRDQKIMLGCTQISVAEHFGYCFNWHPIAQRNSCCKCVPGYMKCQVFIDAADICNLL